MGRGIVASLGVQTAGLDLSFSTCSPAPSELQRSHGYRAFLAQGDLPIIREIMILEQRRQGHPWGCPQV